MDPEVEQNESNKPTELFESRRLTKSRKNKIFAGVCGGIAEYFNVKPFIVRLLFSLFILFGGWGVIIYILSAALLPYPKGETNFTPLKNSVNILLGILLLFAGTYLVLRNTAFDYFLNFFSLPDELIISLMLLIFGVILFAKREIFVLSNEKESDEELTKKILGVFENFSLYTGINVTLLRMAGLIFFFLTGGIGIVIYLILYYFNRVNTNEG